jgi:hypothetical protein
MIPQFLFSLIIICQECQFFHVTDEKVGFEGELIPLPMSG